MVSSMFRILFNQLRDGPEKNDGICAEYYRVAKIHYKMHVETCQYVAIGLAVIRTLKLCMGEEFTDELDRAWHNVYSVMLQRVLLCSIALETIYGNTGSFSISITVVVVVLILYLEISQLLVIMW